MPIITPVAGPSQVADTGGSNRTPTAQAARERAIAKIMGNAPTNQSQQSPVQNPSQVSPEELSAIKAPSTQEQGLNSTNDTVPVEEIKSPPVKEEPALSSQYALLARKEKAFRQKVAQEQATIKAREEAIAKREAELQAKDAEYQTNYIPKQRLTEDTIGTLLEQGISYDQITQMMLSQGTAHQDPMIKSALAKLEAKIEAQEKIIQEAQKNAQTQNTQQRQEAVRLITREATSLVNSDPTAFEAIIATNSVKDVVELIERTYDEDGVYLSVDEAAKEVEEHLIDELSKVNQRVKKLQAKLASPAASQRQAPAQASSGQPGQQQTQKTLTNSMGAGSQLSRRDRAILAFQGKLDK